MSNMAEVNGTDHLVRPEKEGKLNGYDNEGFHCQGRAEDEEESASDDDRLRVVVTENGHRPEDDSHLSNGYVHEENNGHSTTTVNGSAVIVIEESKSDSNMKDSKGDSSQKPLDTRLHHFVPVDDADRKILNGSDGSHVNIPEDAVINFTTGRVKVKKSASNNPPVSCERESIPLETILPSYEAGEKTGHGEKAELEAELTNHKNGLWSEGHNTYSNAESHFGNSEKLNGTSKSRDEVSLPVNNHRKCLSNDVSDTSSEPKPTGEKLYFTEDNRKLCPGWRRIFVCGLILIILAVALLLGVLAATGILLAESESKNTRYESGHSLPSIDSISQAGHSSRLRPSSNNVPQKSSPSVVEGSNLPSNDSVSRLPTPTVNSKVPVLNDTSHSQTIVPNALVGEFTIDEIFTEDLKDNNSYGYKSLATYIEKELQGIFRKNGGVYEELKILNFSPGSIKVKFVTIWVSEHSFVPPQKATEIMKSYLKKNRNSLLAYPVDLESIHFIDVFDECKVQKGGCSFNCVWDYNTLSKKCTCDKSMVLLADEKSCGPKPLTSSLEVTTPKFSTKAPRTTSIAVTEPTLITEPPLVTEPPLITELTLVTEQSQRTTTSRLDDTTATTVMPSITKAIASITELFKNLTTTQMPTSTKENNEYLQNFSIVTEFFASSMQTTTEPYNSESPITLKQFDFTTDKTEVSDDTTIKIPAVTDNSHTVNDSILKGIEMTEKPEGLSNVSTEASTLTLTLQTTALNSPPENANNKSDHAVESPDTEIQNDTTTDLFTTEPYTILDNLTTIGYHIKKETTKIYTLKDISDFDFTPTLQSHTTTEKPATTFETDLGVTINETAVSEYVAVPNFFTEMPQTSTTDISRATIKESEYHTTEMLNSSPTETINISENQQYTTVKDFVHNITDVTDLQIVSNISTEGVENKHVSDFTLPVFVANETSDETTTFVYPTTTSFNKTVTPQFVKLPEVRSFDDDFENDTTTSSSDFYNTNKSIYHSSTEATRQPGEIDILLTSSPTTTLPNSETLNETKYNESKYLETTTVPFTENGNENKPTIIVGDMKVNTTAASNNASANAVTESSTEPTTLFSTESMKPVGTNHDGMDDTSKVITLSYADETTTFTSTEIKPNDGEIKITVSPEDLLAEYATVQNNSDIHATLPIFEIPENDTTNSTSDAKIIQNPPYAEETTNLNDEPTTFETLPNTDSSVIDKTTESNMNVEPTNSSLDFNITDVIILHNNSEPTNESDQLTTFGIFNLTTVIPETIEFNNTNNGEMLVNVTDSEPYNSTNTNETYTLTSAEDYTFPTPPTFSNESEIEITTETYDSETITAAEFGNSTSVSNDTESNSTSTISMSDEGVFEGINGTVLPKWNESSENNTFLDEFGNFTTEGYEVTNETTTNASTGIECREDQFLCEPLNRCINNTFLCDGIVDCPDGHDEFQCKDTCHSNFRCPNSSSCIMSEVRCDGIWDCENGTDEVNCTPTECAQHEVLCKDGSKCIKPGDICDWNYNCRDRFDEVGCIERTTCESSGKFFCNDGLCIPWSLKCDGEHDCKEGEDEGNCTCLSDEFRCNDGKCLKSSSRCDGHQDCHDADDEMGCVTVDSQHIVSTYEPYSGTWGLLCAEDWNLDDGQYLCQELGFGHALNVERVHVSFNGTWMAMRRDNFTDSSLWTERVSFAESCTSGLAAVVECQKFACGEYTGLLHRRRRDVVSSSSSQWPFIGYTSTFSSKKGCLSEILTPIWLITSADCLLSISKKTFNGSDWYVRTNIGRDLESDVAQNHEVLKIITHPHSTKYRSLILRDYDVALIRLKHALVFVSDKIGAICPPDEQVPPGITCFSGVLGTEKPRALPPPVLTINSLALQILDKRNCNRVEHFNNAINQRMLCTQSSEGHTICDNDEGTPLMCLTGINKWFLAGMLTYQRFCEVYSKHPAVFSNLYSMRKFLDQVIGQKQYEVPYDTNMYVIIPPTTPSPTMPETTTAEMTTLITTETPFMDMAFTTISEFENTTVTIRDSFDESNDTTEANTYAELAREENETTVFPAELRSLLDNTTFDDGHENATITVPYEMDFDALNTTLDKAEDADTTNKTLDYFMPSLNDTFTSEDNVNDTVAMDRSREFNNTTSPPLLQTTPALLQFTNASASFDAENTTDFFNLEYNKTIVTTPATSDLVNVNANETATNVTSAKNATSNVSVVDSMGYSNVSTSNFSYSDMAALISTFNDSIEMFKPMIEVNNGTIAMSQPLLLLINDTTEGGNLTKIPSMEYIENITEIVTNKTMLTESNNNTKDSTTTIVPTTNMATAARVEIITDTTTNMVTAAQLETTTVPTINIVTAAVVETTTAPTINMVTEAGVAETKTTNESLVDQTEAYTFIIDAEVADLNLAIFRDSHDLKFGPYISHSNISNTEIAETEDNRTTINFSTGNETTLLSSVKLDSNATSYMTEMYDLFFDNKTDKPSPESIGPVTQDITYTTPQTFETETKSDIINASGTDNITSISSLEIDEAAAENSTIIFHVTSENVTSISNTEFDDASAENSTIKFLLTSENVTSIPDTELDDASAENSTVNFHLASENVTNISDTEFDDAPAENSTVKFHLTSKELTVLPESNASLTSCGVWDENSGILNTTDLFEMWPALGYLLAASGTQVCHATVISPKYVIASINCLIFSDRDMNPDKWTYVGGLYQFDNDTSKDGTQNYTVNEIIPYPSTLLYLNERDVALVKLEDAIKMNEYSKSACIPEMQSAPGNECFTAGWTKNTSDSDLRKHFYSVPLSIISLEECNNTLNFNGMLIHDHICGIRKKTDAQMCHMDLGSPLFCLNKDKRWEIQGILNLPGPCDMDQPAVFSSVVHVKKWINKAVIE